MVSKFVVPLTAVLVTLVAANPLEAQHMNAGDAPCKAAGTEIDHANCLNLAAKAADADLNTAYRRISEILANGDRQKLQSAERTWLMYRDQTCGAERDLYQGGTCGFAAYSACLEAVTRHRLSDLKATYWWKVEKFGG